MQNELYITQIVVDTFVAFDKPGAMPTVVTFIYFF